MLKSISTSNEARICRESNIERDFTTVMKDIASMNRKINKQIQKYEDRQAMSRKLAAQIRSR